MNQGDLAPWAAIAALGAFHGLNPAMGWLFAVALGLHRKSRRAVIASLAPILIGHALAIALVLYAALALGRFVDGRLLSQIGGGLLIGWAVWHALYGHRHRVRFGMRVGLLGLGAWSFLMASAHGAGLMLLPFALPLCTGMPTSASNLNALGVVTLHTSAMLLVIATIAIIVYEWVGVAFLRRAWINLDLIWSVVLAASGLFMIFGPMNA